MEKRLHFRTCHLCEAMCGIRVEHEGDQVLSIKGDPDDVLSKGHICPKAAALKDIHHDDDRLKRPIKRAGDGWIEISWEEALDETASRIVETQEQYGNDAVGSLVGSQIAHYFGSLLTIGPWRTCLGTKNIYSGSSVDQLPHNFAYYFLFGHQLLITVPDIDRTDYLLMLGANPAASNGGMLSTGAGAKKKIKAIEERGGKVVLLDPRRTESTKYVSEHMFIRPSTDAFFLLGVLHVIFAKELAKPGRLRDFSTGWNEIEALASSVSLEQAAATTGIPAQTIERIAVEFATAGSAICYGRVGVSMQKFGALCQWLMQVINVVTGNLDRPGGMMFARTAVELLSAFKEARGSWDTFRSRVRNRPEFGGELPVSILPDEILTPGTGRIKLMVTAGGNAALAMPNGKRLEEAFDRLDFMVSIDPYLNETTRHANIILPPVVMFERGHYDLYYKLYNVRDFAKYAPPLFEPSPDQRSDWDIHLELITRIYIKRARNRFKRAWIRMIGWLAKKVLSPELVLDLGLRFGPYGSKLNPFSRGLNLRKLKKHRHGIDLGPLKPCLPERLFTEDKKIHLADELFLNDVARLHTRFPEGADAAQSNGELLLIGRRENQSVGWAHNSRAVVKGRRRCNLYIHPDDADKRAIQDAQMVRLISRTGAIELPAQITTDMRPGVVCMPHAWGHTRKNTRLSVAEAHPGVSMNDVTDEQVIDELSGNGVVNGVPVRVVAIEADR